MAAICNLGSTLGQIEENIFSGRQFLSKSHRYKKNIGAPCGEVDFSVLNLSLGNDDSDALNYKMAAYCITQMQNQTSFLDHYRPEEIGLFLGTTTMGGAEVLHQLSRDWDEGSKTSEVVTPSMQNNTLVEKILDTFPIRGFSTCFSSACSSSAMAILQGHKALQSGMVKACIVGGFDALGLVTLMGFNSLQVVDHDFCKPFSNERKGINLADGGGLLLLSQQDQGSKPHGFLKGGSAVSEAYHMTKPQPQGHGMKKVMAEAISEAGITEQELCYVNAHGTGTQLNDGAELAALEALFLDKIPSFHSTKKWHGHTLAGSGALECILSLMALNDFDKWKVLCRKGHNPSLKNRYGLSNSFGFGGSNVSLVLEGAFC